MPSDRERAAASSDLQALREALDGAIEILWEIVGLGGESNPRRIERGWNEGIERADKWFDGRDELFKDWWDRNGARLLSQERGEG